jgi:kynureninase
LNNHIRQQYAFTSQDILHGYDPKEAIIELSPREGEYFLRPDDILDTVAREGTSIALVLFSGVQYYTGQLFPMESITREAKKQVRVFPATPPPID